MIIPLSSPIELYITLNDTEQKATWVKGYGPILIPIKAAQQKKKWWELHFLGKNLPFWTRMSKTNFGYNFQKGTNRKCRQGRLLYTTQLGPIYELHTTVDVVTKSHTNSERHCNKWDLLCHRRCFNQAFQSVDNLITSVGWNSEEETW